MTIIISYHPSLTLRAKLFTWNIFSMQRRNKPCCCQTIGVTQIHHSHCKLSNDIRKSREICRKTVQLCCIPNTQKKSFKLCQPTQFAMNEKLSIHLCTVPHIIENSLLKCVIPLECIFFVRCSNVHELIKLNCII